MSWLPSFSLPKSGYSQLPVNSPNYDNRGISFSRRRITQVAVFTLALLAVGGYVINRPTKGVEDWEADVVGDVEEPQSVDVNEGMEPEYYEPILPQPPSPLPAPSPIHPSMDVEIPVENDMWGWSEQQGWVQRPEVGLADLGEIAETRYRLLDQPGEEGTRTYVHL
jgi:hypothetical protein